MKTYKYGEKKCNVRTLIDLEFCKMAENDEKFILISPDVSRSTFKNFFEKYPEKQLNVGIAEQNAVDIAAGMALEGLHPFVYGMATFISMRAYEQIRTSVCYQKANVKIFVYSSGVTGNGGATHHSLEDYGLMRFMPGMTVVLPGDPYQAVKIANAAFNHDGPMFVRIAGSFPESCVYAEDYDFSLEKGIVVRDGSDACIIACGIMLAEAVKAADMLYSEGINVSVVDMHTIKPIDKELVLDRAKKTGCIVTVEDHWSIGGLGTAVAEVLAEANVNCKFKRLGIPDVYPGFGSFDDLTHFLSYDACAIVEQIKKMNG